MGELTARLEKIFPPHWAESWDNTGLTVGTTEAAIEGGILVALDVTVRTVKEALDRGCALLLTHHPFPWRERRRFDLEDPEAALLALVFRHGLNLFAVHTNLDAAPLGHASLLAQALGLRGARPLRPRAAAHDRWPLSPSEPGIGLGRIGEVEPAALRDILARLNQFILPGSFAVTGPLDTAISRVAVCPGAAGDLVRDALGEGADLFIGGEFSHHEALAAGAGELILASASHYQLERPAVEILYRTCTELLEGGPPVYRAETETDPWCA